MVTAPLWALACACAPARSVPVVQERKLSASAAGDIISIPLGSSRFPEDLPPFASLQGQPGATLVIPEQGYTLPEGVTYITDVTLTGGSLRVPSGASAHLRGVSFDSVEGSALVVEGGQLQGQQVEIRGAGERALLVHGGEAHLYDSVIRGHHPDHHPSAMVQVSAGALWLDHSLVVDSYADAIRANNGAKVTINNSIVTAVGTGVGGVLGERSGAYAIQADASCDVWVSHSVVHGSSISPHQHSVSAPVLMDDTVSTSGWPAMEGWAERPAYLAITVDDAGNLDNARDLSRVMDQHGASLTFFTTLTGRMGRDEEAWEALRELASRGHEIGSHTTTHSRLVMAEPLALTWSGPQPVTVSVDQEARTVAVGAAVVRWVPDDSLKVLCKKLSRVEGLGCALYPDPIAGKQGWLAADVLATAAIPLSADAPARLPIDQRMPSAGGVYYTAELRSPRERLDEILGEEGAVVSLAYPGQDHNPLVRQAVEDAGFRMARGAPNRINGDPHLYAPFDLYQSPMSLTVHHARGSDANLQPPEVVEQRIRRFAVAWASMALETGGMGALTIHDAETFSPQELGWLLDALSETGVSVVSMRQLRDIIEERGIHVEGTRWMLPPAPHAGYAPAASSVAIDAGAPGTGRATDRRGAPIYGVPDLGPVEYQPPHDIRTDPLPVGGVARLYADGRFWIQREGTAEAALTAAPAGGFRAHGPEEARGFVADLSVSRWDDDERVWSVSSAPWQELCLRAEGLEPGVAYTASQEGRLLGAFRVDAEGGVTLCSASPRGEWRLVRQRDIAGLR